MTLIKKHVTSKEIMLYSNLNINILAEDITYWKTFKSFLTDKTNKTSRITLIEEEKVISQDHLIAKHLANIS